jgi:hypothetical protein
MDITVRIIISLVIAIIITIIMYFLIYNYTGWTKFEMKKGQNFVVNLSPEKVSKIVFKNTEFKIVSTTNEIKTANVAQVLNGMVAAYEGNTNKDYIFKLSDPGLSSFSFNIPNYNPSEDKWSNSTDITLTGYYKLT